MKRKDTVAEIQKILSDSFREHFQIKDLSPYSKVKIKDLPFNIRIQNKLQSRNINTLDKLLLCSEQDILAFKNLGPYAVENILSVLQEFFHPAKDELKKVNPTPKSLKEVAAEIIQEICKDERQFIVISGRANRQKLIDIGAKFGLTRERTRQIERRIVQNFSVECNSKVENFFIQLQRELGGKSVITFEDAANVIGEDTAKIFWYSMAKSKWNRNFFYDSQTQTVACRDHSKVQIDYEKLVESLPETITEDDLKKQIARLVKQQNCLEELLWIRINQTYRKTGKFYHKRWMTLTFACGEVLRDKFKQGYKIAHKPDYETFLRYLKKFFGKDVYMTRRAVDAKISDYIGVLCERGKYIHPDWVNVPKETVDLIKNFIDNSNRNALLYKEIFESLKDKFVGTQITNQYFLQGVIKLYKLPYFIRKDHIEKTEGATIAEEFKNFFKERDVATLDEVKAYFFGMDTANIALLMKQVGEVISIGSRRYIHASRLNLTEKDYTDIEKCVSRLCQNTPVSSRFAFDVLKEEFSEFLSRNNITTGEKLFGVLQYMFKGKFYFSRPYISLEDILHIGCEKVLLTQLEGTDKIEMDELFNICRSNKIQPVSSSYLIEKMRPHFIRVDKSRLCRPKTVGVTKKVIAETVEILQFAIDKNGGWKTARAFDDHELLPQISIEWNSFLLESVAAISNKKINILRSLASFSDYSSAIFTTAEFASENIESFILKVLVTENKIRHFQTQDEIFNWLKNQGLCNVMFPKFLISDRHLKFAENGRIILE